MYSEHIIYCCFCSALPCSHVVVGSCRCPSQQKPIVDDHLLGKMTHSNCVLTFSSTFLIDVVFVNILEIFGFLAGNQLYDI